MRKIIDVPKEIQTDPKWQKLTVKDGFIIIASAGLGFITKGIVHPYLSYFYVALFPVTLYFLLLPSVDVPKKKNYQTILAVLRKDRKTYRSVDLNYRDVNEEKREYNGL